MYRNGYATFILRISFNEKGLPFLYYMGVSTKAQPIAKLVGLKH